MMMIVMERPSDQHANFMELFNSLPSSNGRYLHGPPTAKLAQLLALKRAELERGGPTESSAAADLAPLIFFPNDDQFLRLTSRAEAILARNSISQKDLLSLTSRQFEELIAEIWHRFGFSVELTACTRDGGYDIVAVKSAEMDYRHLIECKRYAPHRKVGLAVVRELRGAEIQGGATKRLLATTSTFSADAQKLIDNHRWELEGRDYLGVLQWVERVKG